MQNDYSNVCKIVDGKSGKEIQQAYCNLPDVIEDMKEAKKGISFLGIELDDRFILNKDLEDKDKSITKKDAKDLTRGLLSLFMNSPETKYFGLILYAGHGMIKEGTQYILLN